MDTLTKATDIAGRQKALLRFFFISHGHLNKSDTTTDIAAKQKGATLCLVAKQHVSYDGLRVGVLRSFTAASVFRPCQRDDYTQVTCENDHRPHIRGAASSKDLVSASCEATAALSPPCDAAAA